MTKNSQICRSISMSQIPKRSASIQSQLGHIPIENDGVIGKIIKRGYKLLTRFMFTNKNEHTKKYDNSINIFFNLLAIFGLSWLTARNLSMWSIIFVAIYNAFVFLIQAVYLILLIIDFYVSEVSEYQWVTMPYYIYGMLIILSLWLNIKIHLVRSNTISEAICSYSISSQFVRHKNKWLKFLSIAFFALTLVSIMTLIFAYKFSNDLFGIGFSRQNHTPFSCGLFCTVYFYYINVIVISTLIGATGIFVLLATSTILEAKKLDYDIRKYPANDGLDHLIFRYQSIDRTANAIGKHFSSIILALIFLVISGSIILLRNYSRLMISQKETGSMLLVVFCILISAMLVIFLILSTVLNEKMWKFREASQRVSDFQQLYTTTQNSIKLLSFMLRLSNAKSHLKVGSIFSINRQTLFTLFLLIIVGGFVLYSVDNGCLHLF